MIVITRGGGSSEDLWEFNDETLARAVAASKIPVISAIGHERDFSICDYVADFRAPTPSAAAELVIKTQAEMQDSLENAGRRLRATLQLQLQNLKMRWQNASACIFFQRPESLVQNPAQRLDHLVLRLPRGLVLLAKRNQEHQRQLALRLPRGLRDCLQQRRNRLLQLEGKLIALDPRAVLSRGYSILLDTEGRAVCESEAVPIGSQLRGILWRGELSLAVRKQENEDGNRSN